MSAIPALPAGYQLDQPSTPPLPQGYTLDPAQPASTSQQSFLNRAATQPSQFSHANPLRYFDELGQGMAQGAEAIAHPLNTAKAMYNTLVPPLLGKQPEHSDKDQSLGDIADQITQFWGQAATGAAAGKAIGAGAGAVSDVTQRGAGAVAERMYQSALKPSTTNTPAEVSSLVKTGLGNGIPVSESGLKKLGDLIGDLNSKISDQINAGSAQGATINRDAVASRLTGPIRRFSNQVNPFDDLNAINNARDEFLATQPENIDAAKAQQLKQGTYSQLSGRAYGELKSATVESQKALARGIKEELNNQFPELKELNARDSQLYGLQSELERAVNRISNRNLISLGGRIAAGGIGAALGGGDLTHTAATMTGAGLLNEILTNPSVQSRLAISLSKAAKIPPGAAQIRVGNYVTGIAAVSANAQGSSGQTTQ